MNNFNFYQIVEEQSNLYFNLILPIYIQKYYQGKGYYFIRKMLYDLDNNLFLEVINEKIKLLPHVIKMSLNVKNICPIIICNELFIDKDNNIVLGYFLHNEKYNSLNFSNNLPFLDNLSSDYKTIFERKKILLFAKSFKMICNEQTIKYQVLKTIFHEYIHFFESYFLASEQFLAIRESSCKKISINKLTLDEAKALDKKYIKNLIFKRILFFIILIVITYMLFFS